MTPEQWEQAEQYFIAALERAPEERAAFLAEACAGDAVLRREVESLLAADAQAAGFLAACAMQDAAKALAKVKPVSLVGQHLSHYQILALLGAGGMGEVYLAEDTRLGRRVALKLLPAEFSREAERVRRFEREARAVSALNHPNILTLYEVGQHEDTHFIVTEFVQGATLRELLTQGRMKLTNVLDVALQTAAALAAAHAAGVVHRDLKPENLMRRHDGYVKVLDFGLAKLTERRAAPSESQTPKRLFESTASGIVLGTISYMSPEQALGQEVDQRSDIFSFGAVLYEMVAGKRPFRGETTAAIFDAILHQAPAPLNDEQPERSAALERIIKRALEKDQALRYQTVSELRADLKQLQRELDSAPTSIAPTPAPQSTRWGGWRMRAWLALGGLPLLLALWYLLPRLAAVPTKEAPTSLRNATFTRLTDQAGLEYFPSLSPDGKTFVYAGRSAGNWNNWDIYLQRVGGQNPINLTKDSPVDDTQPAFSPEGERIAFRSEREGGGIFVMGATGESVKRLTEFGFNPAWSPDGQQVVFAQDSSTWPTARTLIPSQLWVVQVATGEKRLLTEGDAVQPHWSPHNLRIAYRGLAKGGQRDLWTISVNGGQVVQVTDDAAVDWNPVWSPDGRHLYFASDRGGQVNFWRVPIEEASGKLLGAPEPVTTPSSFSMHLSFSRDGRRAAYVNWIGKINLQRIGFDPVAEKVVGEPVWLTQGYKQLATPDISPDGAWLVAGSNAEKQEDLFLVKSDGTSVRQITDDPGRDRGPKWSPDGKRIAFYSERSGRYEVWTISPDGSAPLQLTNNFSPTAAWVAWSPDGTRIACSDHSGNTFIVDADKPWQQQTPQFIPKLPKAPQMKDANGYFHAWEWSPDGRKLAGILDGVPNPSVILYSFQSQQFEQITQSGRFETFLNDSRRLIFRDQGKLWLFDSQSKKIHEILSLPLDSLGATTLSKDNRVLYFSRHSSEAEIWLLSLE